MKKRKLFIATAFAFCLAFLLPAYAAGADDILGTWLTAKGDSKITIFQCGKEKNQYCGRVTWLREPNYPTGDKEAGKPKHDRDNPDMSKRERPIMGMYQAWAFKFDGKKWSDGKFYRSEDGKTYTCFMELESANRLKVRGYVGVSLLGRTEYWTR